MENRLENSLIFYYAGETQYQSDKPNNYMVKYEVQKSAFKGVGKKYLAQETIPKTYNKT